jgi:limonene-1,2-epoxide hydrolase
MQQDRTMNDIHATGTAVIQYFTALGTKDVSALPLAQDVVLDGPMVTEPIQGEAGVRAFLARVIPTLKRIGIKHQIIAGENACILIDFETTDGVLIEICDVFKVREGKIFEIRPYFDSHPLHRTSA